VPPDVEMTSVAQMEDAPLTQPNGKIFTFLLLTFIFRWGLPPSPVILPFSNHCVPPADPDLNAGYMFPVDQDVSAGFTCDPGK